MAKDNKLKMEDGSEFLNQDQLDLRAVIRGRRELAMDVARSRAHARKDQQKVQAALTELFDLMRFEGIDPDTKEGREIAALVIGRRVARHLRKQEAGAVPELGRGGFLNPENDW